MAKALSNVQNSRDAHFPCFQTEWGARRRHSNMLNMSESGWHTDVDVWCMGTGFQGSVAKGGDHAALSSFFSGSEDDTTVRDEGDH